MNGMIWCESFPEKVRNKSFFQTQHENLLTSSWHAVHVMEEEKGEANWMIARILPDLLRLLHTHCMLEEDFMILSRYPDYFWHRKEHTKILQNWRKCSGKELGRKEKLLLIAESANALSGHISTTDVHLRNFAKEYKCANEISLLKMYGIRFPCTLFPKKH